MSGKLRLAGGAAATAIAVLVAMTSALGASGRTSESAVQTACARTTVKMVCYHSEVRRRAGRTALKRSPRLDRAALLKAHRILRCHRVTHEPCGESFDRPFRLVGYLSWPRSWMIGENLAWGWDSPWEAFQGLMHSPSHRSNILERAYREIGVWQGRSPWGPLWVVEYGRRW